MIKVQETGPVIEVPEIEQQFADEERQSVISWSGWITESIALKTRLFIVKPAPTKNLNLSAAL